MKHKKLRAISAAARALSGQLGWRIACVMVLFFESVIVRRAHRKHVVEVEPRVIEIT